MTEAPPRAAVIVSSLADAPPPAAGVTVWVTDPGWTPDHGDRPDVRPLRPVIAEVIAGVNLFNDALERLDRWGEAVGIAGRMSVDGVSLWHGIREPLWNWLHERLVWAHVVAAVGGGQRPGGPAVREVLDLAPRALAAERSSPASPGGLRALARRWRRRLAPRPAPRDPMADRVRRLAGHDGLAVLVLSYARAWQTVDGRLADPHLDPVVERLAADGLRPIVLAIGMDRDHPAASARLESDERLLPDRLLASRWAGAPADDGDGSAALVDAALADAPAAPIDVAGIDLGPALHAEARRLAGEAARIHDRLRERAANLLAELRPAAIVLSHEGLRATWLAVAAQQGIPTFAVQHGVIYPTHPGYCHRREPGLVLPTRTFVYGDHERRTLLAHGGYREDEVEVSGSPRQEPSSGATNATTAAATNAAYRDDVRRELGVADDDRLLVVSTVHVPFVRSMYYAPMLERLLGGPLPRVHVVFKQHPGERDEGPWRALLEGLARAGGYDAPPISVVRGVDLYRLLRAADAHLGLFSTVLTDAVAAGTPNLISSGGAGARIDLLGYVEAGVAQPVGSAAELLAAIEDPRPADPAARRAFLDDHFRRGDAAARIAAAVGRAARERAGAA